MNQLDSARKAPDHDTDRILRELREVQELCDDLSSTVIAAAFLAPHGNGAKALLDEMIERMAQRAKRKVSEGEAAK